MPLYIVQWLQEFIKSIVSANSVTQLGLITDVFIICLLFRAAKHFRRSKKALADSADMLKDAAKALRAHCDESCVWTDHKLFFRNMCNHIGDIKEKEHARIHIYRGYDQGAGEPNRELRKAIKKALLNNTILEFHRVVVVTDERFIPTAVRWMLPFAAETLRNKCHFYISFRRKFNLGSFVALGKDHCYVAMPRLDTDPGISPSTTQSGVFAKDDQIARIIVHYVDNLREEALNPKSIHVVPFPLAERGWKWTKRRALEAKIKEAFAEFTRQSVSGTQGSL
jgi:hypothetical protein